MRAIGGYFSWEFPQEIYPFPHENGYLLNNARSALQLILQNIENVRKVYLPYYTCDSVTMALESANIPYEQYHINTDFRLSDFIYLKEGEYIIYTNYFGIMDKYCQELAKTYGHSLIIDNAQAFYAPHIINTHSAYSCRKYVGVPDGGIAISDSIKSIDSIPVSNAMDRCGALLARAEGDVAGGYTLFKENDRKFRGDGILQMSEISKKILHSLNHSKIVERRRANFAHLRTALSEYNQLTIPGSETFSCPLIYPFFAKSPKLRQFLIENRIFVAQYWPNVLDWCGEDSTEYKLTTHIMALPIDQRYGMDDMNRIIEIIKKFYGK